MITDALEVGVFIEHSVVRIQEKVKGVLVEEVHLEENNATIMCFVLKITNITSIGLLY